MNNFLMLLQAAEFISKNPDVIGNEHDYASTKVYAPRPRRDSNPERTDRRDRLRPRPHPPSHHQNSSASVKRSGFQSQSPPAKKIRRDSYYMPSKFDVSDRRRTSSLSTVRSTHNQLEKIRRHYMRTCFDQLKETIFTTLHDQRQRGKSRSLSPLSSSFSSSSSSSSSSSLFSCLSSNSGSRASSQQILNMAQNLIKDLEEECHMLDEEKWGVMKSNTSLKRRVIGFQSIPDKVTRSRSAETNCSSGRSSYNSSPEFIDVISDSSSVTSEDSGFAVSPN